MKSFDYNEYLGLAGISQDAIVDVSSALASVMKFSVRNDLKFNANELIDELKHLFGNDGALMIRAFSWQFCKGMAFRPRETKSEVGALGNYAIKRRDFLRTQHPLYSWMVTGAKGDKVLENNSVDAFGKDSILAFLNSNKAVQLLIGEQEIAGLTIAHYAEIKAGVPYRKQKFFEAEYEDREGNVTMRKYSMHVRPLNIELENIFTEEATQALLTDAGIRKNYSYKGLPIATIDIAKAADFIRNDILSNDAKNTVKINGINGIKNSGVDWSTVVF